MEKKQKKAIKDKQNQVQISVITSFLEKYRHERVSRSVMSNSL